MSPRLVVLHLLALAAATAAVWLGLWQFDAWQARRDAEAKDLASAAPRQLDDVMTPDAPFPGNAVGQPVRFEGAWVGASTFFVADRELDGRRGFWVVTPVAVCESDCADRPAMLVVRGWTPSTDQAPPPPEGAVGVTGWLQPPEGSGRQDPDPNDDVLQEMRVADAIQHVDQDLYGAYVIAEEVSAGSNATGGGDGSAGTTGIEPGLEAVTPDSLPEPETFTALRNLLYALEWWVFGAFALFVWWRWLSDEVARSRKEQAGGPDSVSTGSTSGAAG